MEWSRIFLSLIVFCNASSVILAQDITASESNSSREFRVFSLDRRLITDLYFRESEDSYVPLEFFRKWRSRSYTLNTDENGKMPFFVLNGISADGQTLWRQVAVATIGPEIQQALLLFVRRSSTDHHEFSVITINDSESAFSYGDLIVVNGCGAPLIGQVAGTNMEVQPWSVNKVRFARSNRSNSEWVDIGFAAKIKDEFEIVYANRILFRHEARSILVLRPPRRANSILIDTYLLEQFAPSEETEEI